MKRNTLRILRDYWKRESLRRHYWAALDYFRGIRPLFTIRNRIFRRLVFADLRQFVFGTARPSDADALPRADAAAEWIARAQDGTTDDGVSYGYFPCDSDTGWHSSYPETTGYIITSLVDYATLRGKPEFLLRAEKMAYWEAELQLSSGAIQGGRLEEGVQPTPAAFNTGMVLHGWARLLLLREDARILSAARRAADFLVEDMNEDGNFRTNGRFVSNVAVKNYNSLCGWALYLFGQVTNEAVYRQAAIRAVEAAMRAQHENGWLPNNSLGRHDAILTHTLGYTLQAFLEVGVLSERDDLVQAAKKGVDAIIPHIHENGFLVSWFYPDWSPALFSSCLTGSAQLAIVMYRLAEEIGETRYIEHADQLVGFLKSRQNVATEIDGARGALPGSFPISGQYMTRGYPNWATKYLLDVLLLQSRSRIEHR